LHLLGVRDAAGRPAGDAPLRPGDALVVRGGREQIGRFAADHGLEGAATLDGAADTSALVNRDLGVAEVIVAPRSNLIGQRAFPGMVTESGELVVLAVQRLGEDLGAGEATLQVGDALLLQGRWEALDEHTADPNVIVVDSPDAIRRQAIPLGPKAMPALVVLAAMVVLLGSGVVPAVIAGLLAAIAMVVLRVVSVDHAHRAISWTTLILVAGMIPLSTAITDTGVAAMLAGGLVEAVGRFGPYAILLALFLFTAVLGQLISNTATALVILPVAASVALDTGISVQTLMMSVAVSSAAALLTPIATPGNMMVMEPGGYKFGDYVKLGLPVMAVYLVVAVFLVPVFWPM
jgi:di/tricarboxylate transporter